MLVQSATFWTELQVQNDEKHPPASKVEHLTCPYCLALMYGNGWRQVFCVDSIGATLRVWKHRVRCPECGKTITQIPAGLSIFKIYTIEFIIRILKLCLKIGRIPNSVPTSKSNVRRWMKHYQARCIHEGISLHEQARNLEALIHPEACPSILFPNNRENMVCLQTRQGQTHHYWFLPFKSTPP